MTTIIMILIVAITLQMIWNMTIKSNDGQSIFPKKSESTNDNKDENAWKKDVVDVPMADLLSEYPEIQQTRINKTVDHFIKQLNRVKLPKLSQSTELAEIAIYQYGQYDETDMNLLYHSKAVEDFIYLSIEGGDQFNRDYFTKEARKPKQVDYQGFTGFVSAVKDRDNLTRIFVEEADIAYRFDLYKALKQNEWETIAQREIDTLQHSGEAILEKLDVTKADLYEIDFPYFTEEMEQSYAALKMRENTGTTFNIHFSASALKDFEYIVYFQPDAYESYFYNYFEETIKTPAGHTIQHIYSENSDYADDHYYQWEKNGKLYEIYYSTMSEHMTTEEVFVMIDSILMRE